MAVAVTPVSEIAKQLTNFANLFYIVPPQVMFDVMSEGANIAIQNAPVLTGNLRANIFAEKLGSTGAAMHSMAPYSGFVNFGHRTRSGSFVSAQPYWTQGQNYVLTSLMPQIVSTLSAGM